MASETLRGQVLLFFGSVFSKYRTPLRVWFDHTQPGKLPSPVGRGAGGEGMARLGK